MKLWNMLIIGQIILHIITVVSASQLIQSTLGKYQPLGFRAVTRKKLPTQRSKKQSDKVQPF